MRLRQAMGLSRHTAPVSSVGSSFTLHKGDLPGRSGRLRYVVEQPVQKMWSNAAVIGGLWSGTRLVPQDHDCQ